MARQSSNLLLELFFLSKLSERKCSGVPTCFIQSGLHTEAVLSACEQVREQDPLVLVPPRALAEQGELPIPALPMTTDTTKQAEQ